MRKRSIRKNYTELSQGLFKGLLLSWTKGGILVIVNIWETKKLESQMKKFGKIVRKLSRIVRNEKFAGFLFYGLHKRM